MLKPRRLKRPAIRARTPGRFSTRIERTCLRPVSAPAAASRSSSLIRSGVPASMLSSPDRQPTMSRAAAPAGIIG